MDLKKIIELQALFDSEHKIKFNWNEKINEENLNILQFLTIALVGETGEFANIVKKIVRGDKTLNESKNTLSSEMVDVFIYIIKLSYQLNIDLEKAFLEKLKENEIRFAKYKNNKDEI
ncbi:MazG nucleotide pyrophosphohydrolase domain-containing protein [Flavobacterium sp. W22_SRS_FK3]|uniref:MazG nucleotide pyrophosphohydrolase domain-containing protein n=1 Tax=Flavobacterium sp. W22_SRS_FK3 TaxID=3240275 RepID=UPI003F8EA4B9